jgi:hypothetical protein
VTLRAIHQNHDFFEYVRLTDSVPPGDANRIDVAVLDMNHNWPNLGHDAIVHAILEIAEDYRDRLIRAGKKVRVLSFDVRRRLMIPHSPNGRFRLYVGTGGPGHLDPRLNDGEAAWAQGVEEDPAWEAPLFKLFDQIVAHPDAALIGICHSFGLMCRWSGAARPELRTEKSTGMPLNALTEEAASHPWFRHFAKSLADGRHYRVLDNRIFDLILERKGDFQPIAFENTESRALTMVEFARDAQNRMPRILGVNHHPEIIDREHVLAVLDEKRALGEVRDDWYHERAITMRELFRDENERQSRITSYFTLLAPLKHQLEDLIEERS